MLARTRLLEAGHEEAPEGDADLHVVNTCCITREAEAKSRQSVRRSAAARAGRRVVVTGCAANLTPPSSTRSRPQVTALVGTADDVAERGRGRGRARVRRRRDRRARARAAVGDAHPRLREGAGRLRLPLLVLHHPEGARRRALAPRERRARGGAPPRCAGTAGDGDDRDLGRRLPRPRARPRAGRPDARGRGGAGRAARAALVGRGDPRARLARRRARRGPAHLPAPARAAPVRGRRACSPSMGRNYDAAGYLRRDRRACASGCRT